VPADWAKFGHVRYLFAFGALLGPGFITRLPSPTLWLLLVWSVAATDWVSAVVPMAVFGVARALTTGTVVAGAKSSNGSAMVQLSRLDNVADRIPPLEICCLGVAAGMALAFGPG
jgi:hypothetical protein